MSRVNSRTGALLAAIGGLVLFGSLFLNWYRYEPPNGEVFQGQAVSGNAWEIFSAADVLLAALAGIVVLFAALGAVRGNVPFIRYASGLIIGLAGIGALVLVIARLTAPPGGEPILGVGIDIDASRLGGSFAGLAGAIAMAVGGIIAASGVILEAVSREIDRLE